MFREYVDYQDLPLYRFSAVHLLCMHVQKVFLDSIPPTPRLARVDLVANAGSSDIFIEQVFSTPLCGYDLRTRISLLHLGRYSWCPSNIRPCPRCSYPNIRRLTYLHLSLQPAIFDRPHLELPSDDLRLLVGCSPPEHPT